MPKLETILAAAFPALLLAACGSQPQSAGLNDAGSVDSNLAAEAPPTEATVSANAANSAGEPVPPPDAISHPNGFLPYGNSGTPEANGIPPS